MSFWDSTLGQEIQNTGTVLATDWLKGVVAANTKQPKSAPAPEGTLPADVVVAQKSQSNWLLYGAIGVAILGVVFLFLPKRKGKK